MRSPPQCPQVLSAAAIPSSFTQVAVRLDAASSTSRLATATLAAPFASLGPLPPAAMSALISLAGGDPIRTFLEYFAFDFNAATPEAAATGGGVARIRFAPASASVAAAPPPPPQLPPSAAANAAPGGAAASTGSAATLFPVANVTQPVRFQIPFSPLELPDPSRPLAVECRWWDADPAQRRYRPRGCAALPNPYPPNHRLAWIDSAQSYSGGPELRAAWTLSGPLAAGCQRTVVDCSLGSAAPAPGGGGAGGGQPAPNVNLAALTFLDPLDPVTSPSVECPRNSTVRLVIFSGTQCEVWRPGNPTGCHWNVSAQARRAGAGLLPSPFRLDPQRSWGLFKVDARELRLRLKS